MDGSWGGEPQRSRHRQRPGGRLIAAQYLATARRMDLYRIDLASVVSKYIVETEDQMRRVFYVAEKIGAVLFSTKRICFL